MFLLADDEREKQKQPWLIEGRPPAQHSSSCWQVCSTRASSPQPRPAQLGLARPPLKLIHCLLQSNSVPVLIWYFHCNWVLLRFGPVCCSEVPPLFSYLLDMTTVLLLFFVWFFREKNKDGVEDSSEVGVWFISIVEIIILELLTFLHLLVLTECNEVMCLC